MSRSLTSISGAPEITIVTYHYVRPITHSRYPAIKGREIASFKRQLAYLAAEYSLVDMSQVLESLEGGTLPPRPALLTFDDGYLDHYQYVLPVLLQYGISAAFFIPTGPIAEHTVLDVNKLHYILATEPNVNRLLKLVFEHIAEYRSTYDLPTEKDLRQQYGKASRWDTPEVILFKRLLQVALPPPLRKAITTHLFAQLVSDDEMDFSQQLYLTGDHIRELHDHGMHIGGHTHHHVWLDSLSFEEQRTEVLLANNFLSQLGVLDHTWTVCYPYGAYNEQTLRLLDHLKCSAAFTTKPSVASLSPDERFRLPRLDTNDVPVTTSSQKVATGAT